MKAACFHFLLIAKIVLEKTNNHFGEMNEEGLSLPPICNDEATAERVNANASADRLVYLTNLGMSALVLQASKIYLNRLWQVFLSIL